MSSCLFLGACTGNSQAGAADGESLASSDGRLELLTSLMTGNFSSEAQSKTDDAYFDVRLAIVPIWQDQPGGPWLYVEQAMATRLDAPYRQRVYRLSRVSPTQFKSEVYMLPEPALNFQGAWQDPSRFNAITPAALTLKDGCAVLLTYSPLSRSFTGGTEGVGCLSELRGAKYATSRVTVTSSVLESWDQGFDAQAKQVWGAEKGGYRFVKLAQ